MHQQPRWLIKIAKTIAVFLILCVGFIVPVYASTNLDDQNTIDRIQLVTQQIHLLQNRLNQSERESTELQQKQDQYVEGLMPSKVSKSLLDKAALDISVAQSNLDSVNIESTDTQQTITWLEKSVQEIENQINMLSIFGIKVAKNAINNPKELHNDLIYQQRLLVLEKQRLTLLHDLHKTVTNVLALRKENYDRIKTLLKSRHLLHIKQEQVKDELAYQEQQNEWLQRLNMYYTQLATLDPVKSKAEYTALERDIYYANESANYAYIQALIARYDDQIQQMKLALLRSNSISLLNEVGDQNQTLSKQISKLGHILQARMNVLEKHIQHLSLRKKQVEPFQAYIKNLSAIAQGYKTSQIQLNQIRRNLLDFRGALEQSLQTELSARQGFPVFGFKTFIDLGKEVLLVPALTFQMVKSLSTSVMQGIKATTLLAWCLFAAFQVVLFSLFFYSKNILTRYLANTYKDINKISSRWLCLQWLRRDFVDLFVIANFIITMKFVSIAHQRYFFLIYLAFVWLVFKSLRIIARLCLLEATHDDSGHDVRLYQRFKWIIWIGGVITALTVFVHQLPLIYELKTLCDRIFLVLLMAVSLLLLRSYDVVPHLILTHVESDHPYLRRSIRLIGILVPLLLFCNSVIGVFGYLNLIMTVSWYEGVFLVVLIGYLILRGLLSDGMEQVSRLMIQYVNNGWLWTEAFLKPIDKVLRITLFFTAWAVLFILYGWDKQSPIVERLTWLLHFKLASILNTVITPLSMIELVMVISVFYWTAKWTREFIYRLLLSRTKDLGIRNSIAILSQYTVIVLGMFFCLRVLGIDLRALTIVSGMFAFGIGLGLRDLANNFACGFLILLERPLRVGDIVNVSGAEGEVTHIGSRAITVRTWDHMELVVPNAEIFHKSFTNWTAQDNTVRSVIQIKISRYDNPHEVKDIIYQVLCDYSDVLKDPVPEVFLRNINDTLMEFEIRYYVNIRQVKSRTSIISNVLMRIWDAFAQHGIKPPYPQQEIVLRRELPHFEKAEVDKTTNMIAVETG